jgi:hypothetical protein
MAPANKLGLFMVCSAFLHAIEFKAMTLHEFGYFGRWAASWTAMTSTLCCAEPSPRRPAGATK